MYVLVEVGIDAASDPVDVFVTRLDGLVDLDRTYQPVPLPLAEEDAARLAPGETVVLLRGELAEGVELDRVALAPGVLRVWRDEQVEPI